MNIEEHKTLEMHKEAPENESKKKLMRGGFEKPIFRTKTKDLKKKKTKINKDEVDNGLLINSQNARDRFVASKNSSDSTISTLNKDDLTFVIPLETISKTNNS